ncbi:MAG: hypothetical protein JWO36_5515 [Myxococcales bacterium]|nr:hypothetical protein [Myxococcales bacterium]
MVYLVLASGCGRLGFTSTPASDGLASCVIEACNADSLCASDQRCHPIVFADNFDSGAIDPQWSLMRFDFGVTSGHLQTTPNVRAGFNYGQGGNGRSAVAALHIGDTGWTDLRVEWTQQSQAALSIVDPSLPACQHTPSVMWRVEEYAESWNAPEDTMYSWSIDQGTCVGPIGPQGSWGSGQNWQFWIPGQGYNSTHMGTSTSLASGLAPITDTPLHFVLELRGTSQQIWADGALVYAFDDATKVYPPGDAPLSYGGVAFTSAWEQMFWIDDVVIADLTR